MTIGDMLGHEESMLKVWVDERRSRDVNASLMWENLKLFAVLIPAIITIDTFFLQAIFDNELPENTSGFRFLIFLFPSLVITLSLIGESNLKRRWERTLESIGYLNKLEDLLGLRGNLPENRTVFLKDKHLFERYFREIEEEGVAIDTEDDFIEQKRLKNNMYRPMRRVYAVFIVIGVVLMSVPQFLVVWTIPSQ